MMKKKIGLVIQGPLMSIGKSGEQFYWTFEELEKSGGPIHYDCRPNIERIIKEFGHLFNEIVVSVFDNQLKPGEAFEGAKIVSAPDPGTIPNTKKNSYKDHNKFRQFLSTLNGVKELEKSGIDYVVKTRVDTYLDLEKLVNSFFAGIEKKPNPKVIYAPVIHKPTFLIHDLYFAGTTKAMKEFCEAVLAYDKFEFISSAHMEIVLKHAHVCYREVIGVPDWAYFPTSPLTGVSRATRQVFDYMLDNIYSPLDPDIFRFIAWRGTQFPRHHVAELLDGHSVPKKINIPGIISTDWKRYFHFREQVYGTEINFKDRIVMFIGKVGRRGWNQILKIWPQEKKSA